MFLSGSGVACLSYAGMFLKHAYILNNSIFFDKKDIEVIIVKAANNN